MLPFQAQTHASWPLPAQGAGPNTGIAHRLTAQLDMKKRWRSDGGGRLSLQASRPCHLAGGGGCSPFYSQTANLILCISQLTVWLTSSFISLASLKPRQRCGVPCRTPCRRQQQRHSRASRRLCCCHRLWARNSEEMPMMDTDSPSFSSKSAHSLRWQGERACGGLGWAGVQWAGGAGPRPSNGACPLRPMAALAATKTCWQLTPRSGPPQTSPRPCSSQ